MREVLKGLSSAYVLAAALFGGGALVLGNNFQHQSTILADNFSTWLSAAELRAAPPQSIDFRITPFRLPLRGSLLDEHAPAPQPLAPDARPNTLPEKPRSSPVTQFAFDPTSPVVVAQVRDRLQASLPSDLYSHFDLFLYVSKADTGPLAQRMYAFTKAQDDRKSKLSLLNTWPVSTGSENMQVNAHGEKMMTHTPDGYYQLDPDRFYRRYRSTQWGMQMPNSMFLDWVTKGNLTGLAIHGVETPAEIKLIGHRASAGCVELAPEDSQKLFDLIRQDYKGRVPRFAYDSKSKTMNNQGKLARGKNGALKMTDGYRVLVLIENYGGSETVSQLYVDAADISG